MWPCGFKESCGNLGRSCGETLSQGCRATKGGVGQENEEDELDWTSQVKKLRHSQRNEGAVALTLAQKRL